MDLSLSISIGSSVQVALFVAPVLVLASLFLGPAPMDLAFAPGLVMIVLLSVLIMGQVAGDGPSDWLKGMQLLAVYLVLGLTLLAAAGVPAHRFHDLKATFTTELARRVSDKLTQRLSRHRDSKTTDRYIEIVDKDRRAAVASLGDTAFGRLFAPQSPKRESQTARAADGGGGAKSLKELVGATGFEPATPRPPV